MSRKNGELFIVFEMVISKNFSFKMFAYIITVMRKLVCCCNKSLIEQDYSL